MLFKKELYLRTHVRSIKVQSRYKSTGPYYVSLALLNRNVVL
jgi:hypothetical protein